MGIRKHKLSLIRRILGALLLALGVISIIIPFLPSFLLIVAGAYLLDLKWLKQALSTLRHKWKRWRILKKK